MKSPLVNIGTDFISMCVILVKIKHGNFGNVAETCILLDSCSQVTFMLERLINDPEMKGRKISLKIKTLKV